MINGFIVLISCKMITDYLTSGCKRNLCRLAGANLHFNIETSS